MKLFFLATALAIAPFTLSESNSKKPPTIHLTINNTVIFEQALNPLTVHTAALSMVGRRLTLPPEQIMYVIIASPGGMYESALWLRSFINNLPNTKLLCLFCASGSGLIFAASTLPRLVFNKSTIIMHEMFSPHTTARHLQNGLWTQGLIQASRHFNTITAKVLKMSVEEYEQLIAGVDWVVMGEQAIKLHLADTYVLVKCDQHLTYLAAPVCN